MRCIAALLDMRQLIEQTQRVQGTLSEVRSRYEPCRCLVASACTRLPHSNGVLNLASLRLSWFEESRHDAFWRHKGVASSRPATPMPRRVEVSRCLTRQVQMPK